MTVPNLFPLFNHLWQSTIFALIAAVLVFALRKNRAQARYALWLAASLKFVIPFSLLIALGSQVHWHAAMPMPIAKSVQQINHPFTTLQIQWPVETHVTSNPLTTVVLAIWLCGFLTILISWLYRWRQIRAAVRSAVRVPIQAPIPVLSTSSLLEPGVFGAFRPVLLLPQGILNHLTAEHLEAILAHELCHARRRDNLAAAIHMLIEAVFWFHPLVWWIGSRLIEERERACDEEVLRQGNRPHIYAESILKTCQFYLESPLPCLSGVTGADLKKRVVHIMTARLAARLTLRKKLLLATAAIAAIVLPVATGLATQAAPAGDGQSPAKFEVASIKPSKPGGRGLMIRLSPGGRIVMSDITVERLIEMAYDVKDGQVSGLPGWARSEKYDIEAKPDDEAAARFNKLPDKVRGQRLSEMLRQLLADRFALKLDHSAKAMNVLALTIAKGGPKLHKSALNGKPGAALKPPPPPPPGVSPSQRGPIEPGEGLTTAGPGNITGTGAQISTLVSALTMVTHQIVVDRTGLNGDYDFTLHWTPDVSENRMVEGPGAGLGPGGPGGPGGDSAPPDTSGPSLFTAIQQQLGLKLQSQKTPVDILVIANVEKPSEN